jgi:hypothetical protein
MKRIIMIAGLGLVGFALYRMYASKQAASVTNPANGGLNAEAYAGGVTNTQGGGTTALGMTGDNVVQSIAPAESSPDSIGYGGTKFAGGGSGDPLRSNAQFDAFTYL